MNRRLIIAALLTLLAVQTTFAQELAELPPLTGAWAVGRAEYAFVDAARPEIFLTGVDAPREVAVRVYYPVDATAEYAPAPYAAGLEVDALAAWLGYAPDIITDYIRSYAVTGAPAAEGIYPVVLFTGDISAPLLYYSGLLEDLASNGYIVVAVAHPYSSPFAALPDGRVAFAVTGADAAAVQEAAGRDRVGAVWAADLRFVLDQLAALNEKDALLTGRLGLSQIVSAGHGFGAAAALDVALNDSRIVAGISLDGRALGSADSKTLSDPYLFIDPASDTDAPDEKSDLDELQDGSSAAVYAVTVSGADAATFATDTQVVDGVFGGAAEQKGRGETSTLRSYLLAFLGETLKGIDAPLLDSATATGGARKPSRLRRG